MDKRKLREIYREKREALKKEEVLTKSILASSLFLKDEIYKSINTIMLYVPLKNEISTKEIIEKAYADGKKVAFPVTNPKTFEITPCYAEKNSAFCKGTFSVNEPKEKDFTDINNIDLVIVPGVAFSKKGERIGFGKGCFDKLLENYKGIKVGFCYDFQVCSEIEAEKHDVRMDYILTEKEFFTCGRR